MVNKKKKSSVKTVSKLQKEARFKSGAEWKGNKDGRPKGQRNYSTIYKEALAKIAKSKDLSADELENLIIQSGLEEVLKKNYAFYRDHLDRWYGQPPQGIGSMDEEGNFKEQSVNVNWT